MPFQTSEVKSLYLRLIEAWNRRSAQGMAELFADDGEMIGFDGSLASGRKDILAHLTPVFANHTTPPYVCKIKAVRPLGDEAAILRAIAGMTPPGQTELNPELNAHQTLVAIENGDAWRIAQFQTTPAQFHGRPELVRQMTEELKAITRGT